MLSLQMGLVVMPLSAIIAKEPKEPNSYIVFSLAMRTALVLS